MSLELQMVNQFFSDESNYKKDFETTFKRVSKSKAIYKGAPVPYLHIPKFYSKADVETFKYALKGIHRLCRKTIDLYLEQEDIRSFFGFDSRLEELIKLEHYYKSSVPMGRFDIFYYGIGDFKFCELNADGASAMNEDYELSKILRTTELVGAFEDRYEWIPNELFHSWVAEVKVIYEEFIKATGQMTGSPTVAILDFIDKGSSIEFEVFKEVFEANGYKCIIVDPRNIQEKDGLMYFEGEKIDIVYRRLVTKDLMDRYDEIPEFIAALKANRTCVVGSIKTQIIHTKRFFELLYEPKLRHYFSDEDISFIERHVPYTRPLILKGNEAHYLENRENYIIKPIDYYASKGVCAGIDYEDSDWKALLYEKEKEGYIIQQYCPVALVDNLLQNSNGLITHEKFNTVTGLFTYNEKLSGIYVRAGLNAIVSGLHDGFTMATLIAVEK